MVVGLFVVLSPKVSSLLLPFKRQVILNDFINKTKMAGVINSTDYWQFREFYSPGYFIYSKNGIEQSVLKSVIKKIGIDYPQKTIDSSFLFFSSPWLNSLDMLTKQVKLDKVIDLRRISKESIIFVGKNCLIYRSDPSTIKIVFLLRSADMQKVSGISDYQDPQSMKGENWLNITSLKTN